MQQWSPHLRWVAILGPVARVVPGWRHARVARGGAGGPPQVRKLIGLLFLRLTCLFFLQMPYVCSESTDRWNGARLIAAVL